jgi:DHA2 family multidrug resistance protein
MMVAMLIAIPVAGAVYNHLSPRLTIVAGILVFAAGAYELSKITLGMGQWDLALPMFLEGSGLALIYVPLETTAFSRIPRHLMADAAGLSNVLKETGGAIGLALFTSVFVRHTTATRAVLAAHVGMTNPLVGPTLQKYAAATPMLASRSASIGYLDAVVGRQATLIAYQQFFLLVGMMILCLLPFLVLLKADRTTKVDDETESE